MNAFPCTVTRDTARHLDRQEAADSAYGRSHALLKAELTQALLTDARQVVATPEWHRREAPAFDVVNDEFAGFSGEANLLGLLNVLAAAAKGTDAAVAAQALAWVDRVATSFADYHATSAWEETL